MGALLLRQQPSLETERLLLRPFFAEDAPAVHERAGAPEVADTAISIPVRYSLDGAKAWIAAQVYSFRRLTAVHFAMELRETGELIGAVELGDIDREHLQAELSFWVGAQWWGQGYATEVAGEIMRFGFDVLELNRIYAKTLVRSAGSARVMRKLRMRREGVLRERVCRDGKFEDVGLYAALRDDPLRKPRRGSQRGTRSQ